MKLIKKYETETAFEAEKEDLTSPWVTLTADDDKVHYSALPDSEDDSSNSYGYVDLGLPSGTLWATCNIGATKPEEYGKYFQWSATVGYEGDEAKSHSIWATAPFNNGSSSYDSSYFTSVKDTVCPNGVLASQYDAAYKATNGQAHMPTFKQIKELTANTTTQWTTENGVNGRKFTSKTDTSKYIFIPASGYFHDDSQYGVGSDGYVWSSSLYDFDSTGAYNLGFNSGITDWYGSARYYDLAVRPVIG